MGKESIKFIVYTEFIKGNVTKINKYYPLLKECSFCGTVKKKLDLNERIFKCENCGFEIARDHNVVETLILNLRNARSE